jgi:hypothetical protein
MAVFRFLQRSYVYAFYRRNAFFFGVVLFFFVGIVRPPHFFFSADFVGNLLTDWRAVGSILGIAVLYFAYVMRFLLSYASEPENQFLHVLPALGKRQLLLQLAPVAGAVLAPALAYLGVMAWHGWQLGMMGGIPAAGLAVLMWAGGSWWLQRRLLGALTKSRVRRLTWSLKLPRESMPMLYWGLLRRRHRSATFVIKAVSLLLLFLLLLAEALEPNPYALQGLCFVLVGVLHGFLLFRLRGTEALELSWFRNLPYGWSRKWGQWAATLLLLCLPELVVWLLFLLREGISPLLLLHYCLAILSFWSMALGLTYLKQVRPQDLATLMWSLAFGLFIAFLFKVSFLLLYLPLLGLAGVLYARLHR